MEEKLINFLKRKRVYKKFIRNMGNDTIPEIIITVEGAMKEGIRSTPIQAAFVWARTPEGVRFWGDINNEWINYYTKL